MAEIEIRGLTELENALAQLEGPQLKKVVRSSLRKGAKEIQAQAKADAPKRTGTLASSIKVRSGGTKAGTVAVKIVTSNDDHLFKGDQFYGAFLEFGYKHPPVYRTESGQIKSKPRGTEPMTLHEGLHYMKHAAESSAARAVEAFSLEVKKRIEATLQAGGKNVGT